MRSIRNLLMILALLASTITGSLASDLPHLKHNGNTTQLIVDGEPMLLISGELRNSTSSALPYARHALDHCQKLGLNSVIATISWEQFEPQEGVYDYTLVDGLIEAAEERDLKLVLIWFASYKNGKSTYAPGRVKRDTERFPRVLSAADEPGERRELPEISARFEGQKKYKKTLSPTCAATWTADARAFAALMRRIKKVDKKRTVVMMQVENEPGLQDVKVDQRTESLALYHGPLPQPVFDYMQQNQTTLTPDLRQAWTASGKKNAGSWPEVFGNFAPDAFAAWSIAHFMEQVTQAGKAEYDIPMYYNTWVKLPADQPGDYPTGGPIHSVLDIYRATSPSIDLLAPDLYVSAFKEYCRAYRHPGNTLLIPECRLNNDVIAKAYWAFAEENALGFAPFAIDDTQLDNPLIEGYRVLRQLEPLILAAQGTDRLKGFYRQVAPQSKTVNAGAWSFDTGELEKPDAKYVQCSMGSFRFTINHTARLKNTPSYGLLIQLSEDEFLLTGQNIDLIWDTAIPNHKADVYSVEQGEYVDGKWQLRRRINGDGGTKSIILPLPTDTFSPRGTQHTVRFKLYTYPAIETTASATNF